MKARILIVLVIALIAACSKPTEPPKMRHFEGTFNASLTPVIFRSLDSTWIVDLRELGLGRTENIDDTWMRELLVAYNSSVWEDPTYYHLVVWTYDGFTIKDPWLRLNAKNFMVNLIAP